MQKICSQCKQIKPLTEFYKANSKPGGYSYSCKLCSDAANKKTRDKYHERYLGYRAEYKRSLNERVNTYKCSLGCRVCGENSHPSVLDMHHLDPTIKEDAPSMMRTSWDRWIAEASKCIVLCANCHRKVHAGILEVN